MLKSLIALLALLALLSAEEGIEIQKNCKADGTPSKIAILTVIIGGNKSDASEKYQQWDYCDTVSFGTRSKELYAKKQGYDLIIAREPIREAFGILEERPLEAAWTKVALISQFLEEYDWVFWSDADSAILDLNRRLEEFLDPDYDIIACDIRPDDLEIGPMKKEQELNTGEVFYKNSERTKSLLFETWLCHSTVTPGAFEQQWINQTLHRNGWEESVKVYPQKAFNTPPELFTEGDFIMHLYGYHGKELVEKFIEVEKMWGYLIEGEQ